MNIRLLYADKGNRNTLPGCETPFKKSQLQLHAQGFVQFLLFENQFNAFIFSACTAAVAFEKLNSC